MLIAGGLINALVGMLVTKTGLSGTDRVLGMVFGAARGVLIVGIVVMIFRMLDLDRDEWWSRSTVIPYGEPVAEQLQHYFHRGLERLDELVEPEAVGPAPEDTETKEQQPPGNG